MENRSSQSYELHLSPQARAWVERYEPKPPNWYEKFVSTLIGAVQGTRQATLEQDRFLLECLAEQCGRQGVRFPNKVFVAQTPLPNAAYLPLTHSFMATTDIMKVMPPNELRAVIGHEVGHGSQGGWILGLTLLGALGAHFLAMKCLPKRYAIRNDDGSFTPVLPQGKDIKSQATRFFSNGFVQELVSWYAIMISASLVTRQFESDADRRGAKFTSPQDMADALRTLGRRSAEIRQDEEAGRLPSRTVERTASKILNPLPNHPSLESRVERLERMNAERRAAAENRALALA